MLAKDLKPELTINKIDDNIANMTNMIMIIRKINALILLKYQVITPIPIRIDIRKNDEQLRFITHEGLQATVQIFSTKKNCMHCLGRILALLNTGEQQIQAKLHNNDREIKQMLNDTIREHTVNFEFGRMPQGDRYVNQTAQPYMVFNYM